MDAVYTGALWLTAANLAMRGVSLAFQAYTARVLGASGVGLLQLILTVGALALTVGAAGARVACTCLVAQETGRGNPGGVRSAVSAALRYALAISLAAAAALWCLAPALSAQWIGDVRAVPSLRVFALALPANCLWMVLAGYYTAAGRVRRLVAVQVFDRLLTVAVTLPLLWLWAGDDLERACCAIMAGSGAVTFFSLLLLWRGYCRTRPAQTDAAPMTRRLLKLCGPLAFNELARAALGTVENLLIPKGLSRWSGSREQALAAYGTLQGMTFPAMMLPSVVLTSLADLMIPTLARCREQGDTAGLQSRVERSLHFGLCYAAGAAGVLLCCGDVLGTALYGSAQAGAYLRGLAPVVLILYVDTVVDGNLKGLIEQVACVRYNTVTSVLDVALLLLLLPRWGIGGFVFSFVVTHTLNLYLSAARLWKVTGLRPNLRGLARVLAIFLAALLLTLLLTGWLRAAAFLALYVCALSLRPAPRPAAGARADRKK